MTAILATTAAVVYGCADFLGGLASRKDAALKVAAVSQALGLLLLVPVIAIMGTRPLVADIGWGAAAGLFGGIGVAALYAGLGTGRMSLVAPVTAALAASIPAVYDLLSGGGLSITATIGVVLAIAAIVVVSLSHDEEVTGKASKALLFAFLAGACFGLFFIGLSFTTPEGGLWPLVGARSVSVPLLSIAAIARHRKLAVTRAALPATFWAGIIDMVANLAVLAAVHRGPLALASVLASLYPVATVLLARFVLHERLNAVQRAGVAMALVAVVLASVP